MEYKPLQYIVEFKGLDGPLFTHKPVKISIERFEKIVERHPEITTPEQVYILTEPVVIDSIKLCFDFRFVKNNKDLFKYNHHIIVTVDGNAINKFVEETETINKNDSVSVLYIQTKLNRDRMVQEWIRQDCNLKMK